MNEQRTRFEDGFFDRQDETEDTHFYGMQRLVTHIDDGAIAAVGELYEELGLTDTNARVLDICSSWVSHLPTKPGYLSITGMNPLELAANAMADEWTVLDLNEQPALPFENAEFDAGCCCVSVDYLVQPVMVFQGDGARVETGRCVCLYVLQSLFSIEGNSWLAAS